MRRTTASVLSSFLLALLATGSPALSQDTPPPDARSDARSDAIESDVGVDADLSFAPPARFGTQGQEYWSLTGGAGFSLESGEDSTDPNITIAYHRFLIDDFEIIADLGAWYFAQDGDDQAGINPGFTLRYHLVNRDRWSFFLDAGIGLLFSTGEVPDGGTSFNFTPHAGGGATWRLGDSGARLLLAARWHHISNARISGDSDNPDRDGVMVYGGVMWPF